VRRPRKPGKLLQLVLAVIVIVLAATFGLGGKSTTPAPKAAITTEPTPHGVTDCETGITPQAADQLSELDLYNARIWVMRNCGDGVSTLHYITQATLDCEAAINNQYPDPIAAQRDIYERALKECPDEQTGLAPDGTPYYWHN
jgi:hypothetical protein